MSEPTLICAKISAKLTNGCLRGSATISFAPFSTAFFKSVAATGWASIMFVPMQKNILALPNSANEFVIAPEPNEVARPATVGACQVRAQ